MRFVSPKKYLLRAVWPAACLLLATACTKVVDLDLPDAPPRLMLEANLADDGQPCTAQLSRSARYTDTNTFPPVRGATLTLSDDAGHSETLLESSPGQYRGRTVLGQLGRRYTLRVEAEGQQYVAQSTMPAVVPLTGLRVENAIVGTSKQVVPEYQDPAGRRDYYLFRQYRNGRLNKTLFAWDDELTDGKPNARALTTMGGGDTADQLAPGDSVRVEMQTVDAAMYEYLRTLNLVLGGNSAAPANPTPTFTGNALGYFSAHTRQRQRRQIP